MESPATWIVERPLDYLASTADHLEGGVEHVGNDEHERATAARVSDGDAADLAITAGRLDVGIAVAVIIELPAEDLAVEPAAETSST